MAALQSSKFVPFTFPPKDSFCGQKIRRPTTPFSSSGYQVKCRNTILKDHNKIDDNLPSFENPLPITPPSKTSLKASKPERTYQHPKEPALGIARIHVDQTESAVGDNPGQPMILDDDDLSKAAVGHEAAGSIGGCDTGRAERDASLHNTFVTSELVLEQGKSIDVSDPWYGGGDSCHIDEHAPRLGSSASGQGQAQILFQFSTPSQDQINQQDIVDITQNMSAGSDLSLKPSDNGDYGWTENSIMELERELRLALEEEQMESSLASTPTTPSPRSIEAPQNEIQSREHSKAAGSTSGGLQEVPRYSPSQSLEKWEHRGNEVVAVEELGQPAVGDQQALVEVANADELKDKEAIEPLPATQSEFLEIDEYRFRLRGVRVQQLSGRQTKTTQYRVVWGEHPNRSDSWFNEDDIQISMSCEPDFQDLALQVRRNIIRVQRMRCSQSSKSRKNFQYLVDKLSIWITEDQLRISPSPMLIAKLKPPFPHQTQREVILSHSPISFKHCYPSKASQSPSASTDLASSDELERGKWGEKQQHQDTATEISIDAQKSENSDRSHETNNDVEDNEDPRPTKRRKLPPTPIDNTLAPLAQPPKWQRVFLTSISNILTPMEEIQQRSLDDDSSDSDVNKEDRDFYPEKQQISQASSILRRNPSTAASMPQDFEVVRYKKTSQIDRFQQTRSGRTSIQPVAWWKNEWIEYSNDVKEDVGGKKFILRSIKGVIRTTDAQKFTRERIAT